MIKIGVSKGRIEKDFYELLEKAGYNVDLILTKGRKLNVITSDNIEYIFMKPNDIVNFVNYGILDAGIVGNDTIDEYSYERENNHNCDELLDLNIAEGCFCLARLKNKDNVSKIVTIASKYPFVARKYFLEKYGIDIKVIKLEGSVELGPILGISDAIVDIVETGNTLKANELEVLDIFSRISTRYIVNKSRYQEKKAEINSMIARLKNVINISDNVQNVRKRALLMRR